MDGMRRGQVEGIQQVNLCNKGGSGVISRVTTSKVDDIVASESKERSIDYDIRILLIDDDNDTGATAKEYLVEEGFANVHWVQSGQEALSALREENGISIVISDMRMPEMTGTQTMSIAHKEGLTSDKNVIFFSGNIEDIKPHDVLNTGALALYRRMEIKSLIVHIKHLAQKVAA